MFDSLLLSADWSHVVVIFLTLLLAVVAFLGRDSPIVKHYS
jgi:hypothetical protein